MVGPVTSPIIEKLALGFPWVTADPFLFCVRHDDPYPGGTDTLGPPSLPLPAGTSARTFEVGMGRSS